MPRVGVRELKNRASEILRAVREEGAEYIITYQGRPSAILLPIDIGEEELEDYILAHHPHFVELRERACEWVLMERFPDLGFKFNLVDREGSPLPEVMSVAGSDAAVQLRGSTNERHNQPGDRDVTTAEWIPIITNRIVRNFHPLRIILFGSHARGDAGSESDVDLLVVLPQVTDKRKAAVEIRRALSDFSVAKDIIVTTPEEIVRRGDLVGTVLRPALREGKVLYERG